MDDSKLAFGRSSEQKPLYCDGGGIGENGFLRMDLVEGSGRDLIVGAVDLVDDLFDAFNNFLTEVGKRSR